MDERSPVANAGASYPSSRAPARGRPARDLVSALALSVAFIGAVGPSAAVTLNPGDILVTAYPGEGAVILVNPLGPPGSNQTVVSSGRPLQTPIGIAIANGDPGFDLLVVDSTCCGGQGGVIRVNPADGSQTIVSPVSSFPSYFVNPVGIAIAPTNGVFVVDQLCCGGQGGVIQVFPDGSQWIVSSGQLFQSPIGIAVDPTQQYLYVADQQAGILQVTVPGGTQTPVTVKDAAVAPEAIAIAGNDLLVIEGVGIVQVTPADGGLMLVSAGQNFVTPFGLAIAGSDLFVADEHCCAGNQGGVIQVNTATGQQVIVSSGNNFGNPTGIAIVPEPSEPRGSCGGTVPCACGDRVLRDRTLRGADPVTRAVCPADGLVVADGVTLDLGGATLRGQGAGAGVRIEAGAANVTVRRGNLVGFATGVRGEGTTGAHLANLHVLDNTRDGVILTGDGHTVDQTAIQRNGALGAAIVGDGSRLSGLKVTSNGRAGIRLVGRGHRLEQSHLEGNGEHGVEVSGDDTQVVRLQVQRNGGAGVFLRGTGNTAARIIATGNRGDGLQILGARATVALNRATSNGVAGLEIHGAGHTVARNIAGLNIGSGLQMVGTTGSRFDRNRGEHNGDFGITDDSSGAGTGGTANAYTANLCGRGNGAGVSSPAGLCR